MKEVKIPLEQIKELREKTLIGIKDCKDALIQSKGDIEKAENILIKTGRMKVNDRLNRKSDDGAVFTYLDNEKAVMLVQTCETNSVALNKRFRSSGQYLVEIAANNKSNEITEEMKSIMKDSMSIFKENMKIREIVYTNTAKNEHVEEYIHNDGQIAANIKIRSNKIGFKKNVIIRNLCRDLTMHICAMAPIFKDRKSINIDYLKKHEEIFSEQSQQVLNASKEIRNNIANGKLNKHLSTVCLMDQNFIKDNKKTIKQIINEAEEVSGIDIELVSFSRLQV